LTDLVAQYGNASSIGESGKNKEQDYFPSHVGQTDLSLGVKTGSYYRGVLRSKDLESGGWVTIRRGEERVAVTIEGSIDRNRAVDGDVVAISLHPLDKWLASADTVPKENETEKSKVAGIASDTAEPTQSEISNVPDTIAVDDDLTKSLRPTGKVVGILRRNFANYSGSIFEKPSVLSSSKTVTEREKIASQYEREHPDGTTTCVFFPVDSKIPPILIKTTQRERFLGQRIVVSMDSWPSYSPYPLGHYVKMIGPAGSKDVETEVLLQQFKIAHEPFPAAVLACLPPNDYKIKMVPERTDLRHLPVLSIDPPGCKDIDDALHCITLPNGNFQVGVHIADVTHYVKAGMAMDLEAANRSTSTYLVNKRLDMLPGLLTTDLCSLKGNVDR
jgi:exosome complex exonuclease DIS3/RRP44